MFPIPCTSVSSLCPSFPHSWCFSFPHSQCPTFPLVPQFLPFQVPQFPPCASDSPIPGALVSPIPGDSVSLIRCTSVPLVPQFPPSLCLNFPHSLYPFPPLFLPRASVSPVAAEPSRPLAFFPVKGDLRDEAEVVPAAPHRCQCRDPTDVPGAAGGAAGPWDREGTGTGHSETLGWDRDTGTGRGQAEDTVVPWDRTVTGHSGTLACAGPGRGQAEAPLSGAHSCRETSHAGSSGALPSPSPHPAPVEFPLFRGCPIPEVFLPRAGMSLAALEPGIPKPSLPLSSSRCVWSEIPPPGASCLLSEHGMERPGAAGKSWERQEQKGRRRRRSGSGEGKRLTWLPQGTAASGAAPGAGNAAIPWPSQAGAEPLPVVY